MKRNKTLKTIGKVLITILAVIALVIIVFVDGKLLTMCESASAKYYFGLLTDSTWCYATDLGKIN